MNCISNLSTHKWRGLLKSVAVLAFTFAFVLPANAQPTKSEVVQRLKNMQIKLTQEIGSLENSTKKRLNESTAISLKEDPNISGRKIIRLADQIADIDRKRNELLARRDFIDQLALQVDSKWQGQQLQKFLEHTILDMSVIDLTNPQGSGELWRFCTFLSIAIREIPTGRDDVMGVLEDYMSFASVLNPKTPAEFLSGRDYTNTTSSVSARPSSRESLGDELEEKLRSTDEKLKPSRASGATSEVKSDIELRLRLPLTPPAKTATPTPAPRPQKPQQIPQQILQQSPPQALVGEET